MTPPVVLGARPTLSAVEIVEQTRAIRWWIDRRIELGETDDEIAAGLPVAISVISGRIPLRALAR